MLLKSIITWSKRRILDNFILTGKILKSLMDGRLVHVCGNVLRFTVNRAPFMRNSARVSFGCCGRQLSCVDGIILRPTVKRHPKDTPHRSMVRSYSDIVGSLVTPVCSNLNETKDALVLPSLLSHTLALQLFVC